MNNTEILKALQSVHTKLLNKQYKNARLELGVTIHCIESTPISSSPVTRGVVDTSKYTKIIAEHSTIQDYITYLENENIRLSSPLMTRETLLLYHNYYLKKRKEVADSSPEYMVDLFMADFASVAMTKEVKSKEEILLHSTYCTIEEDADLDDQHNHYFQFDEVKRVMDEYAEQFKSKVEVTDEDILTVIHQYPHSLLDEKKVYFESIVVAIVRDLLTKKGE